MHYIINKFCLEKIPKSQEKGKIGGQNYTSFQTVLYSPDKKSGKQLKPSLLNEYSAKVGLLIKGAPEECIDVSVDPYVCLLPKQAPHLIKSGGASKRGAKGAIYKEVIPNPYGYFSQQHANEEFKKYYTACSKPYWKRSIGHILVNLDDPLFLPF